MARGSVVACGSPSDICAAANTNSLEEAFLLLTGSEERAYA
jgi:hypothetical protein